MKLVEIVDEFENLEFENNRKELQHLFKVQAARCREIDLFILKLARQFPNWWATEGKAQWEDFPTREWDKTPGRNFGPPAGKWLLPRSTNGNHDASPSDAANIASQFISKYTAMISAKRQYEQAGGNY